MPDRVGHYGKHLDGHMYFTHFGTPLLTVLLAFTPCGKSFSFDRLRALRRAEANGEDPPAELAPAWGQTVLRLHLSIVYLYAGLDKLDAQWFAGERLQRIWVQYYGSADSLVLHPAIVPLSKVAAATTTVVEIAIAIAIWVPKWRKWAAILSLGLHWSFWLILDLWPLTLRMWLVWLAVPKQANVHRFIDRLLGHTERPVEPAATAAAQAEPDGAQSSIVTPRQKAT